MVRMGQPSQLTETIVKTVAEYENVSPADLPPLAERIDSETFHQLAATDRHLTESVEFSYLWYQITVDPNERISITP